MAKETLVTGALGFVKWNNKILGIHEIFFFETVVQTVIVYCVNYAVDAVKDVW